MDHSSNYEVELLNCNILFSLKTNKIIYYTKHIISYTITIKNNLRLIRVLLFLIRLFSN